MPRYNSHARTHCLVSFSFGLIWGYCTDTIVRLDSSSFSLQKKKTTRFMKRNFFQFVFLALNKLSHATSYENQNCLGSLVRSDAVGFSETSYTIVIFLPHAAL